MSMLLCNIIQSIMEQNPPVCVCSWSWGVTWWLSGAGLQGAGLFSHRFGEGVTASDQLPALVTLDVPHPHTHPARLRALRKHRSRNKVVTLHRWACISAISTSKNFVFSDQKHWPISSPKPTRSKLTRAACFAWTSPQTRGWCTIWSTASQSRCFPLQASRCLHTPLRQRPGTFLHWCRHTWRSFASRLDHRSCYTTDKNRKFPVFSPHTVSQSSY